MVDQKFRHASNSILSRCHVSQRFDGGEGGVFEEKNHFIFIGDLMKAGLRYPLTVSRRTGARAKVLRGKTIPVDDGKCKLILH